MFIKLMKSDKNYIRLGSEEEFPHQKFNISDFGKNLSSDSDDEQNGPSTYDDDEDEFVCKSKTETLITRKSNYQIATSYKGHANFDQNLKQSERGSFHTIASNFVAQTVYRNYKFNDNVQSFEDTNSQELTTKGSVEPTGSLLLAADERHAAQQNLNCEEDAAIELANGSDEALGHMHHPLKALEKHKNPKAQDGKDFGLCKEVASDQDLEDFDFEREVKSIENLLLRIDELTKKLPHPDTHTINNAHESKLVTVDNELTKCSSPVEFEIGITDSTEIEALKQNPTLLIFSIDYIIVQDPLDSSTQLAKYGLLCMQGMQIPYIYRGVHKFCPLFLVDQAYWHKLKAFQPLPYMSNCIQIPTVYATAQELATFRYMGHDDPTSLRSLVRVYAAKQFYEFLRQCILRTRCVGGVSHPFGFISVAGQIMPYLRIGEDKFIPTSFLTRSFAKIDWSSDVFLLNWKLAFIKYACRLAGFPEAVKNDFVLPAVDLLQLMEQLPEQIEIKCNVWLELSESFKGFEIVEENFPVWTAEPNEWFKKNVANNIVDYACWQLQVLQKT